MYAGDITSGQCIEDTNEYEFNFTNSEIVNSIYIDTSTYNYTLDYVFLSAQPLACIVLYSNDKCQFKCFSINGNSLHSTENDTLLTSNKFNEYYFYF